MHLEMWRRIVANKIARNLSYWRGRRATSRIRQGDRDWNKHSAVPEYFCRKSLNCWNGAVHVPAYGNLQAISDEHRYGFSESD